MAQTEPLDSNSKLPRPKSRRLRRREGNPWLDADRAYRLKMIGTALVVVAMLLAGIALVVAGLRS